MTNTPDRAAIVEQMADAMRAAVIRDDEGEFPRLFDLLDCSGENKSRTIVRGLASAALDASGLLDRCRRLEEALDLAANRLGSAAVNAVCDARLYYEYSEWAKEARAALADHAGQGEQG